MYSYVRASYSSLIAFALPSLWLCFAPLCVLIVPLLQYFALEFTFVSNFFIVSSVNYMGTKLKDTRICKNELQYKKRMSILAVKNIMSIHLVSICTKLVFIIIWWIYYRMKILHLMIMMEIVQVLIRVNQNVNEKHGTTNIVQHTSIQHVIKFMLYSKPKIKNTALTIRISNSR